MGRADSFSTHERATENSVSHPTRRRMWRRPEAQANLALVADEDGVARRALVGMLEEMGWEVMAAHDGLAALEIALDCQPRVAFVDDGMAWVSGLRVCQYLHRRGLQVRMVLMTASAHGEARAQAAGAAWHVRKPLRGLEVIGVLRGITDGPVPPAEAGDDGQS